jgi:hypothetical protein
VSETDVAHIAERVGELNTMRAILTASILIVAAPALAASPNESACIIKAGDTLPKIAGMKIGKSTTTQQPAPPNWPSPHPPIRVEIEWTAANANGTALVERTYTRKFILENATSTQRFDRRARQAFR